MSVKHTTPKSELAIGLISGGLWTSFNRSSKH